MVFLKCKTSRPTNLCSREQVYAQELNYLFKGRCKQPEVQQLCSAVIPTLEGSGQKASPNKCGLLMHGSLSIEADYFSG